MRIQVLIDHDALRVEAEIDISAAEVLETLPELLATLRTECPPAKRPAPKKQTSTETAPTGDFDAFELFWGIYPKAGRANKTRARRDFAKAVKRLKKSGQTDSDAETVLISAAREYADSEIVASGTVRHASTWLNGSAWEDDRAAWGAMKNGSSVNRTEQRAARNSSAISQFITSDGDQASIRSGNGNAIATQTHVGDDAGTVGRVVGNTARVPGGNDQPGSPDDLPF